MNGTTVPSKRMARNFERYLDEFQKAVDQLNRGLLEKKQVEVAVRIVLDSVFLKLYKKAWANPSQDPPYQ